MGSVSRAIVAARAAEAETAWHTVTLTKAPSVNNLYPTRKGGGGRVKSAALRQWIGTATYAVRASKPPQIIGPYEIRFELGRRKGSDLFNYEKAAHDLYVAMRIVADDSLCERGAMAWADDLASSEMRISIRPLFAAPVLVAADAGAEEWRSVPSFPNYSASSLGRIRGPRKILTPRVGTAGYSMVAVSGAPGVNVLVHRMVCEAFHGKCPKGKQAAHLNGDRLNNLPRNLTWVSAQENASHKHRHGTVISGEDHYATKATARQIEQIQALYQSRLMNQSQLAKKFGLHKSTIGRIVRGENELSSRIQKTADRRRARAR